MEKKIYEYDIDEDRYDKLLEDLDRIIDNLPGYADLPYLIIVEQKNIVVRGKIKRGVMLMLSYDAAHPHINICNLLSSEDTKDYNDYGKLTIYDYNKVRDNIRHFIADHI